MKGENNVIHGVSGAPGIAIGKALIFNPELLNFVTRNINQNEINNQLASLQQAFFQAYSELSAIYSRTASELGRDRAGIFQAQLMILEDPDFEQEITDLVKKGVNAEAAVGETITYYIEFYHDSQDDHRRERASDYRDVGCRLLRILLGQSWNPAPQLTEDLIILARDLTSADIVHLDRSKILGIATESGSRTSTAAILAKSLEVPAAVNLGPFLKEVQNGDIVIVDGGKGILMVRPDEASLSKYKNRLETYQAIKKELHLMHELPAMTTDAHKVELLANIDHPSESLGALAHGAGGIGLFRTEYLFSGREHPPSEDEQYEVYMQVINTMGHRPVTIRTLDLGPDKSPWYMSMPVEPNPFLGCRGIRLSLNFEDVFKAQMRAILRASAHGNVKVMFPMISRVDELRQVKSIFGSVRQELQEKGIPFNPNLEIGMLIEVPSAAMTVELFAPEVDFFSIGTNDLVQYTLALDRLSDDSASDQALHPAVLRLIRHVVDAAREVRKPVSICGEVAASPLATVLLMGLRLNSFSCAAGAIPEIKKVIRGISTRDAFEVAKKALKLALAGDVKALLEADLRQRGLYF